MALVTFAPTSRASVGLSGIPAALEQAGYVWLLRFSLGSLVNIVELTTRVTEWAVGRRQGVLCREDLRCGRLGRDVGAGLGLVDRGGGRTAESERPVSRSTLSSRPNVPSCQQSS